MGMPLSVMLSAKGSGGKRSGPGAARAFAASARRLLPPGEPREVKARQGDVLVLAPPVARSALVQAEERQIGQHGQIAVARPPLLQHLRHRPRPAFVVTHLQRQALAVVPDAARLDERILQVIRVGEEDAARLTYGRPRQAKHAGHADRLQQGRLESRLGPAAGAVGADRHQPPVLLALAANVEEHAAVGQLGHHGFARVAKSLVGAADDLAAAPTPAAIVAIDQRYDRGAVPQVPLAHLLAGTVRHPDRHDEPPVAQLRAVARPGGDDPPRVVAMKLFQGGRDFHRRGERGAVVAALDVKDAAILVAIQGVDNAAVAVAKHHEVADRPGAIRGMRDDQPRRLPSAPAVATAAQQNVVIVPIAAAASAGLNGRQHRAAAGYHQPGNAAHGVAYAAALEEGLLLQQRRGPQRGRTGPERQSPTRCVQWGRALHAVISRGVASRVP